MSPEASDDLTIIIDERPNRVFAVLLSPDSAEHDPAYQKVAYFLTREAADAWRPA
jgi:hypothetical protein